MKGLPAETDFIVIGAGVAGLRAAIELAAAGRVLVLAKKEVTIPTRSPCQADRAALSDEEEVILHLQDTLIAGDGLCHPEAVKTLVEEGPERIEELIAWGSSSTGMEPNWFLKPKPLTATATFCVPRAIPRELKFCARFMPRSRRARIFRCWSSSFPRSF